jgi:hypothetical protein
VQGDGHLRNDGTGAMGWNAADAVTIVPRWHMPMILDPFMLLWRSMMILIVVTTWSEM